MNAPAVAVLRAAVYLASIGIAPVPEWQLVLSTIYVRGIGQGAANLNRYHATVDELVAAGLLARDALPVVGTPAVTITTAGRERLAELDTKD